MNTKQVPILAGLAIIAMGIAAPAYASDATGNIQLSVPSEIQCRVKADGTIALPSASALAFQNNSNFEVRIASVRFREAEGVNVVEDAADSSLPNSISLSIGTKGEKLDLSEYTDARKKVENDLAWTMTTSDINETTASLPIVAEGYGTNIQSIGTIGEIEWYVVSDTVTNQVFQELSDLDDRVSYVEKMEPVGTVIDYAGSTVPADYLECNGQAVSRSDYPELFVALGTSWGAGDGSTTFNVPDLNGKTVIGTSSGHAFATTGGEETHKLTVAEMPSHQHRIMFANYGTENHFISFTYGQNNGGWFPQYSTQSNNYLEATGGNGAHNNMQPYATVHKIIRAR